MPWRHDHNSSPRLHRRSSDLSKHSAEVFAEAEDHSVTVTRRPHKTHDIGSGCALIPRTDGPLSRVRPNKASPQVGLLEHVLNSGSTLQVGDALQLHWVVTFTG